MRQRKFSGSTCGCALQYAWQPIELTRQQLAPLGEADLTRIHVRDAAGKDLLCQAVDVDYDAYHTPDIVIFQSDFTPNRSPLVSLW